MSPSSTLEYGYKSGRGDPPTTLVPAEDPPPRNVAPTQHEGRQVENVVKGLFTGTIRFPIQILVPSNSTAIKSTGTLSNVTFLGPLWHFEATATGGAVYTVFKINLNTTGAGAGVGTMLFRCQGNGFDLFTIQANNLWSQVIFAGTQNGGGFQVKNASFNNVVFDIALAGINASMSAFVTTFTMTGGNFVMSGGGTTHIALNALTDHGASSSVGKLQANRWRFKQNIGDETNAGSIVYRVFDLTALEIIGAGTTGTNRLVHLYDALGIGAAPNATYALLLGGRFRTAPTITAGAGASLALLEVTGTTVEATSGNHPRLSLIEFSVLGVTAGAATVTDATTVYIAGAPAATVTGKNRALWVVGGEAEFGGVVTIGLDRGLDFRNQTNQAAAAAGTLNNAPAAGDPAMWVPVVVNGVNRAVPAW